MNTLEFLATQSIELQHLLVEVEDDPILAPQIAERLKEVQERIEAEQPKDQLFPEIPPFLPRAAVFLRGSSVVDSTGIRPSMAGEALIQYEKMFTQQAIHDEREAAIEAGRKRRPKGSPTPTLLFTGTPRGSFGFEFIPQIAEDQKILDLHANSLKRVAETIERLVLSDGSKLDEVLRDVPSGVLQPLKSFFKTLAAHEAEVRLAFPDSRASYLDASNIKVAAERLEREVAVSIERIPGTFRGVTRESGVFDLRKHDDSVITGVVADYMTEDDIDRIDLLTNEQCLAELEITEIRTVTGSLQPSYVLIDATKV